MSRLTSLGGLALAASTLFRSGCKRRADSLQEEVDR